MSLILPSTVTEDKYITMPSDVEKVVEDEEEWEKCGQWILPIPDNDMSWADNVWTDLQALLKNRCLLMLKTSTAAFKESGVIFCVTRPGQEEAKKAAEAIRDTIRYDYKAVMLYKSVKDSKKLRDRRFGNRYISKYMHTFRGRFYARDANERWQLVREPDVIRKKPVYLKRTLAHRPLPSTEKMIVFDRNSKIYDRFQIADRRSFQYKRENQKQYFPKKGFWHFKCSLQIEEDGLPEADRVWLVVKRLFDKGSFINITSVSRTDIEIADIFCYVSDYSNVQNLVNDCKSIITNSHFSAMSNFFILPGSKDYFLKYVLTPQLELYEEVQRLNECNRAILNFISEV